MADTWHTPDVFLIAHERNRREGEQFLRHVIYAYQRYGTPNDATRATDGSLGIDPHTLDSPD